MANLLIPSLDASSRPRRLIAWWAVVSLVLAALALLRLTEVFLKRELLKRVELLTFELERRESLYQEALNRCNALRVDLACLEAQAQIAPDETYLVLVKSTGRGRIMMGSKIAYEFRFRIKGGMPLRLKGQVADLPEGILSVMGKEAPTVWYRPDWLYEKAGRPVPVDSADRRVTGAFGPCAISLGGAVALHGPVLRDVPQDEIDHVYAELNERDMKAVFNALRLGSRVMIQH